MTLRVVAQRSGSRNATTKILAACSTASTEAYFDTTTLSDAEARFVVAGNVIHVTRVLIRASGDAPADLERQTCRKSRVALLRISLVSGAPDEKWRPNEVPKGPTPSLPKLAPGNVDALCSGGGKQVLVRVLDVRRESLARRTGGGSSFPTASLPRVASRPAVSDACGVAPQSLCLVTSLGSAAYDGATTIVLKSLTVVAPIAAAPRSGGDRRRLRRRFRRRRARVPAKRRLTMVQANLLSPDHGKPTFFVSPTGVEDFPNHGSAPQDRLAELAEDAAFSPARPRRGRRSCVYEARVAAARGLRDVELLGGAALYAVVLERVLRASVLASTNPVEAAAAETLRNLSRAAAAGLSAKEIDGVFDDLLRGLRVSGR